MDPITLLVGGGLVAVPSLIAWVLGRAAGVRAARAVQPPELVCSCGHGYGTHADGARCGAETLTQVGAYSANKAMRPCPCGYYDGPEPLPRTWAPPAIP